MKRVTLGGDRLGAGKKQQVDLHGYERSTHDLSQIFRTTMSAGTLVPFMRQIVLPGDTWDIELNADVKTHPTAGPLFGSYKLQLDVFEGPVRLYQGDLHNNKLGIGMKMSNVLLPQMRLTAIKTPVGSTKDLDNAQINPSCLLKYLGLSGIGYVPPASDDDTKQRLFNGHLLLQYWDQYKNYYSNKQEEIGAVIYPGVISIQQNVDSATTTAKDGVVTTPYREAPTSGTTVVLEAGVKFDFAYTDPNKPIPSQIIIILETGQQIPFDQIVETVTFTGSSMTGYFNFGKWGQQYTANWRYATAAEIPQTPPVVRTFPLSNIDVMREKILQNAGSTPAFIINDARLPGGAVITPYDWLLEPQSGTLQYIGSQSGLAIKTYQSDLFNNWLQTEWIDGTGGITEITSVDVSSGFLQLDSLNLAKKVYMMLNRIMVSGGTYDDWQVAVYDHEPIVRAETPIYHGGLSKELIFQEVVSNAQSDGINGTQPLGTLAGKGAMASKHKGGSMTIRVNEIGYIMGIVSLTPRIDYSQGNMWDMHLNNMDDFHKPQLDEIGFQELITEQMAWWDTTFDVAAGNNAVLTKSAGKQPAWLNYMTEVNRVYGNFAIADNEMFMTLNRRYENNGIGSGPSIKDLTTYIDPVKYNFIFAQTSLDAQNFWVQIAIKMTARRKMSAKVMPNL